MSGSLEEFRGRCSIGRLVKSAGRAPRSEFRSLQARTNACESLVATVAPRGEVHEPGHMRPSIGRWGIHR